MESSFSRAPQMSAYFCRISPDETVKSRQIFKPLDTQQKAAQQVVDTGPLQAQHCAAADQQKCGDRLTALHSRLHQEADKIRKWKTATDIELRQKEKQLQDATHSIETQKKAVFELQIENEALITKMHEEVTHQHEVCKRIEATREMCNVLKDHICRVEQALEVGANDRMELQKSGGQRYEQYQELVAKFQAMEIYWIDRENTLLTTINSKETLNGCLQKQLSSLSEEIGTLKECASASKDDGERAKAQVELSKEIIDKLEKTIQILSADLLTLQEELRHKSDSVKQLECTVQEQRHRLDQLATETAILQNQATLKAELDHEQCKLLQNKLTAVDLEKKGLCESIISLQDEVGTQNVVIRQLEEKVASASKETQVAVEDIIALKAQISAKTKEVEEIKHSLSHEVMNLTEQLVVQEKNIHAIKCAYQQACDQVKHMEMFHVNESEKMNYDLQIAKNEILLHATKVISLEEELRKVQQESESLSKEIRVCGQDLVSQQAENTDLKFRLQLLSENEVKMQSEIIALQKQLNDKEVTNSGLMEQLELDRKMHADEIQSITVKNTTLNKAVEENQRNLDLLVQLQMAEVESYKTKLADVNDELRKSKAEMKFLEERSKQDILKASKEHEVAKHCFDSQVNELCAMLEKYKIENLKIVTQKDREIETFQQRVTEAEALKNEFEGEVMKFRVEISGLIKALQEKEKELETCKKAFCVSSISAVAEGLSVPACHTMRTECNDETIASHISTVQSTPSSVVPNTPRQNVRSSSSRVTPVRHHLMDVTSRCNSRCKKQALAAKLSSTEQRYTSEDIAKSSNLCGAENTKTATANSLNEIADCQKQFSSRSGTSVSEKKFQQAIKKKQGKKLRPNCGPELQDTSWFDLDSVFGFGPND